MVFIRTKKVKGENYLYLVRSKWDAKKASSRQEIIKYLGNAQSVSPEDIPIDYRNDPKIASFLYSNIGKSVQERDDAIKQLRKDLLDNLTSGQRDIALKIYETFTKGSSTADFFDKILKPVMYEIGDLWATNKLNVASEHIASNIANDLVKTIGNQNSRADGRAKIIVCTPPGEEHNLGCNVLEAFLQSKRYTIFNLSPNVPTVDVIDFIRNDKPDLVLVSITLDENIKPGQRFIKKLSEKYDMPILVGGLALTDKKANFDCKVIQEDTLPKIYNLIRTQLS